MVHSLQTVLWDQSSQVSLRHHLPLAWAKGHRIQVASIVFFVEVNEKIPRFQRAE